MNIAILGPSTMVHLRRLVPALVARGHNLHVVSMKPEPIAGATFERFTVPRPSLRYPYRWHRRREMYIKRLLQRFDAVTVHFLSDWRITPQTVGDGVLIARAYGSDVDPPPGVSPREELVQARRSLLRCADSVVVPSQRFRRTVAEFAGIDDSSMRVILGGVDTALFAPRSRPRADAHHVVGYFKGFEPVYGPMTLVDAIPQVLAQCPNVRFDLLGSGALLVACRRRAVELNVEHAIRWLNPVPHKKMPAVMSDWDVVAISSLKESFCVAAIEASAMELPVVATNVGGLPEAVADGESGLLVEPDNPQALAAALVTLLTDPDRLRSMGIAGRRRVVKHFQWHREVDDWIALYETLCNGRSDSSRRYAQSTELISTGGS